MQSTVSLQQCFETWIRVHGINQVLRTKRTMIFYANIPCNRLRVAIKTAENGNQNRLNLHLIIRGWVALVDREILWKYSWKRFQRTWIILQPNAPKKAIPRCWNSDRLGRMSYSIPKRAETWKEEIRLLREIHWMQTEYYFGIVSSILRSNRNPSMILRMITNIQVSVLLTMSMVPVSKKR